MGHPRIPDLAHAIVDAPTPTPLLPPVVGRRLVLSIHGHVQLGLPVPVVIGLEIVNPTQYQILPPFPSYILEREIRDVPRAHGYDVQPHEVGERFLRPEYRREDVELLQNGVGTSLNEVHVVHDVRDRRSAVIGELHVAVRVTLAGRNVEGEDDAYADDACHGRHAQAERCAEDEERGSRRRRRRRIERGGGIVNRIDSQRCDAPEACDIENEGECKCRKLF